MLETLLNPINWSFTYGPQELDNWNDRISIYQQLSSAPYYTDAISLHSITDADDYMQYTSKEVK